MVLQVAGSTAFVILTALFVQSFFRRVVADPGFDTTSTLGMNLEPRLQGYGQVPAGAFFEALAGRVAAGPGIRRVALTNFPPFGVGFPHAGRASTRSGACGGTECPPAVEFRVTPGYFDALRIHLLRGRDFAAGDDRSVAIVNETMATRLWPDRDPVGQWFYLSPDPQPIQVVGVL